MKTFEGRLREQMIEEMELKGLKEKTREAYLSEMRRFVEYFEKSPDELNVEDIKKFQRHLFKEVKLAPRSINRYLSAARFFYRYVMARPWYGEALPRMKAPSKIPTILSEEEVARMIDSVHNVFWKAILMVTYSAGLRSADVRNLRVCDIDSKRMVINVRQGKGSKDRQALLSPVTLSCLRTYWRLFRRASKVTTSDYLFVARRNLDQKTQLAATSLIYIVGRAAHYAGIKKKLRPMCFAIVLPSIS